MLKHRSLWRTFQTQIRAETWERSIVIVNCQILSVYIFAIQQSVGIYVNHGIAESRL